MRQLSLCKYGCDSVTPGERWPWIRLKLKIKTYWLWGSWKSLVDLWSCLVLLLTCNLIKKYIQLELIQLQDHWRLICLYTTKACPFQYWTRRGGRFPPWGVGESALRLEQKGPDHLPSGVNSSEKVKNPANQRLFGWRKAKQWLWLISSGIVWAGWSLEGQPSGWSVSVSVQVLEGPSLRCSPIQLSRTSPLFWCTEMS